jgi:hypothetical protein
MSLSRNRTRRQAASLVEFAIVGGVTIFLVIALIVGAMGVFRYQEVAHLAREGSRYASTHGGTYHQEGIDTQTGVPQVASSADLLSYLQSQVVSLDSNSLTVAVSWSAPAGYTPTNLVSYDDVDSTLVPPGQITIYNNVTVTVTYQWMPELFLVGPITLSSTSTTPMSY